MIQLTTGARHHEIADQMGLSRSTIHACIATARAKLHATHIHHAIGIALRNGWLE